MLKFPNFILRNLLSYVQGKLEMSFCYFVTVSGEGKMRKEDTLIIKRSQQFAAARVCIRAEHVGFVVDEVTLQQVFSEYFGFPCQS
jgi:hypothetical protein